MGAKVYSGVYLRLIQKTHTGGIYDNWACTSILAQFTGSQGLQGLSNQGSQGLQGLQGNQGLQGVQGLSNQGVQGNQGLQGLVGNSNAVTYAIIDPFDNSLVLEGVNVATVSSISGLPTVANTIRTATTIFAFNGSTTSGYRYVDLEGRVYLRYVTTLYFYLSIGGYSWGDNPEFNEDFYLEYMVPGGGFWVPLKQVDRLDHSDGNWVLYSINVPTAAKDFGGVRLRYSQSSIIGSDGTGDNWAVTSLLADISGIQGMQGTQGTQGTQGLDGKFAGQGVQGLQGLQGIIGIGDQGAQGTQGIQSAQGLQGVQGLDGKFVGQGVQGLQGIQSSQGLAGSDDVSLIILSMLF